MIEGTDRPLIWIGCRDYGRLLRAVDRLAVQTPNVSACLFRERNRSIVRPEGDLPWTIVRMGSRVLFRCDDDVPSEWGNPVHPDQPPTVGQVTVVSSPGVALLGLRKGARMAYSDADGATCSLSVECILAA